MGPGYAIPVTPQLGVHVPGHTFFISVTRNVRLCATNLAGLDFRSPSRTLASNIGLLKRFCVLALLTANPEDLIQIASFSVARGNHSCALESLPIG
jgi:hypothetical protein